MNRRSLLRALGGAGASIAVMDAIPAERTALSPREEDGRFVFENESLRLEIEPDPFQLAFHQTDGESLVSLAGDGPNGGHAYGSLSFSLAPRSERAPP